MTGGLGDCVFALLVQTAVFLCRFATIPIASEILWKRLKAKESGITASQGALSSNRTNCSFFEPDELNRFAETHSLAKFVSFSGSETDHSAIKNVLRGPVRGEKK